MLNKMNIGEEDRIDHRNSMLSYDILFTFYLQWTLKRGEEWRGEGGEKKEEERKRRREEREGRKEERRVSLD